jgi:hypothetical protein
MVASDDTVHQIYVILCGFMDPKTIDKFLMALTEVRGNKSFRDTIDKLFDHHQEMKRYSR